MLGEAQRGIARGDDEFSSVGCPVTSYGRALAELSAWRSLFLTAITTNHDANCHCLTPTARRNLTSLIRRIGDALPTADAHREVTCTDLP
jgi:hypothetical protein